MRAGAAVRAVALDVLLRVEQAGAYASILLDHRERDLDGRDAALAHELVLGVLRRRAVIDHALSSVATRRPEEMDPDIRTALRLGVYSLLFLDRVPDFAAVDTAVRMIRERGHRGRAGFVNAVLRRIAASGRSLLPPPPERHDVAGLALHHSFPHWWVTRVVRRSGWDAAAELLEACNRPAPTVLRPNLARVTPDELAHRLDRDGIRVERCHFVPEALRLVSGRLRNSTTFGEGLAWVQDEAAQLVPSLFDGPIGPWAADLCAAPGGKTMQLAERLTEGGLVVAIDRHAGRLRRLAANVAAHWPGRATAVRADASTGRVPLRPGFRQVLLDAPCSGTGTLRRHPEIRWRLAEDDLKLLSSRQRGLLESAASLLASDGSIVYSVCSLEPEEGEAVVNEFLADHPEFGIVDSHDNLAADARQLIDVRGCLRTSPILGGMDGFFAVRLARRGAAS